MDRLTQLRTFVRVAERASFSAVARDMGVTQSAVSRAIRALEESLGARLVSRSTRNVSLTEAGQRYYERCRRIIEDLDEADALVSNLQLGLTGTLNIAAPVPFGLMFISPLLIRFRQMHPGLVIDLELNDKPSNLVEQNIDVAIRLGHLATPGIVARKLGDSAFVIVASPAYLAGRGRPGTPGDLHDHECLLYSNQLNPGEWTFTSAGIHQAVAVSGSYRCNNLLALKDAAVAGLGVACLPQWMVDVELDSGSLCHVLPEACPPAFDIHAVFPSARQIPAKVSVFVEFLREELGGNRFFSASRRQPAAVESTSTPEGPSR